MISSLLKAKEWLRDNPTEAATAAARIFGINAVTLWSSISRDRTALEKRGRHNKAVTDAQIEALKQWTRSQCEQDKEDDLCRYLLSPHAKTTAITKLDH